MEKLTQQLKEQFQKMCATGKLYRSIVDGSYLWNVYLARFENDPVFRDPASSTHNCNNCNNFIRRYGNIVALDDNLNIMTIFDVIPQEEEYVASLETMSSILKVNSIKNIFIETFEELNSLPYESCTKKQQSFKLGIEKNFKQYTQEEADAYGGVEVGKVYTFNHMMVDLPREFVDFSGKSVEAISAEFRTSKEVFQRAMEEISLDTLVLVKDLIIQNSLLDGQTHLHKVEAMIVAKTEYDNVSPGIRNNWCWNYSYKFPFAKFKNELIGVLCTELAEGKGLNESCLAWNKRVDPANYMKAIAPITKKQIAEAEKFVVDNGYEASFERRMSTLDDISVDEILHANSGSGDTPSVSIFNTVKSTSTRHKRSEFDGVEEVSIEKFMKDILPTATSIEAFLTNQQKNNLVTLTTPVVASSKPIFKWSNNFSWTYNGNLAGASQIKEAVKTAGGNVSGILRSSMIWNEQGGNDNSDLDLWCEEPTGRRIGFSTDFRRDRGNVFSPFGGQLDLDNTNPGGRLAVENIYYQDSSKLKEGTYRFWVHQYSARNSKGFKFEIEVEGDVYQYEYNKPVSGIVNVASVTYKNGNFTVNHLLPSTEGGSSSQEVYGLETNKFHKVNLVCLSPNHWGENNVGNKHYFFMLEGCVSPGPIRSFHNENLIPELAQHRKVLEVLGNTTHAESIPKQLSGLGFNATVKDELIVKVSGSFKRMLKIKFA